MNPVAVKTLLVLVESKLFISLIFLKKYRYIPVPIVFWDGETM